MARLPARVGALDDEADAPALGELERVRQHVLQHLFQPRHVGADQWRQRRIDRNAEVEAFVMSNLPEAALEVFTQVGLPGGSDAARGHGARLDLRQVEQIVDQAQKIYAGVVNLL